MARWKTDEIVAAINKLPQVTRVDTAGQGGDCDTNNLVIHIKGSGKRLFMCGFTSQGEINTPNNVDVEMVELNDGGNSWGHAVDWKDLKLVLSYQAIYTHMDKIGFNVVQRLKDYF